VTEIPEHLLKRSAERRAALGGDGGSDDSGSTGDAPATPAATTPATTAATAPAGAVARAEAPGPVTAPPPPPDSPTIAAAKSRRKIPFWAMAALSLLPVWAFMYAKSLTSQPEEAVGPLGAGGEIYGGCASCHGGGGDGGIGYAFTGGEVVATFPNIEDQLRFVYFGTGEYNLADVDVYGDPDREGGAHSTGERGVMPQQGEEAGGSLADQEILAVVCHERYALGGADPAGEFAEEFEKWCSAESELYHALEGGEATLATLHEVDDSILPIGDVPIPGSPAR